jgi:capsular exopolysaccharide synthesis family protein
MQGLTLPSQGTQLESPGAAPQFSNQPTSITPADFRKLLFKRKWIIVLCGLAGIAVAVYSIKTTVPQYQATARVNMNLDRQTDIGIESLIQQSSSYGEADEQIQTQVQIMRSQTVAVDAMNLLDIYHQAPYSAMFAKEPYDGHLTPEQRAGLVMGFQGATKIDVVPDTGLVDVSFESSNPTLAMNAANAIVEAYKNRDLQSRYQGTTQVSGWLAQQLSGLKGQVESNQKALSDYVQKHNLLPTSADGGNLVTDSLTTVNQQLAEAKADRIVKEARYKMAQTRNPELLVSVAPGTILTTLRGQQAELMVQKTELQSKFGPQYPKVVELNKQLGGLQTDIDSEITNLTKRFAEEYNTAQQTEDLMQSRLDSLKQSAYQENESTAQFDILKHGAESSAELYDALELKLQEAGITAGLSSNSVDVVDLATLPLVPVLPNKRSTMTMGIFGGLVLGVIIAFLMEMMDDTLRTSEEVETISKLPSLAVVPHFAIKKETAVQQRGKPGLLPDMVAYLDLQSLGAEAFRTLRSSILLSAVDLVPKVLLITSSLAEEGKSTVASNLAISFAQRKEKVLLVDTDLRRGTTHLKFGLPNRSGLSTILSRESGEEAYTHPIADMPNLTVISRGPIAPNPGEMLASHAMEDLLLQWRGTYDRIVLDSSPELAVSDSLGLAPQADHVMILVRSGVTRKKALLRTQELLRRSGARISGTIVNDVNLRLEHYYTYSKGYSYGYKSNYGAGYGVSSGGK